MYILFTTPIPIHTPLVFDCPHSKRTFHTLMGKLHTLMRKCRRRRGSNISQSTSTNNSIGITA